MDSGHPPFFGMYLAICWQWFGQSLTVSHFAILPFTLASIFFLYRIGQFFLGDRKGIFLVILLLADPTFAAQNLLISPDACLMAFFLTGVYAVLFEKKILLAVAALGLAAISMRGMMVVVVLYVWQLLYSERQFFWKTMWQKALPFVPSGLFALAFLSYHYHETGWIGYHEDSPWAESFQRADFSGFIHNVAVYGWRLLDFGRFSGLLLLALLLFLNKKLLLQNFLANEKLKKIALLLLASLIFLSPSLLLYKYLSAHRYFLPIYFSFHLLTIYLLFELVKEKWAKWIFVAWVTVLFSGNFWMYPKQIAQGWDANLAFLPYDGLRKEMIDYIDHEQIPLTMIGTVFPEVGARKFRELNGRAEGFKQANLATDRYIFYASVMNDFSDVELEELEREWRVRQRFERFGVEVILYKQVR